MNNTHRLAVIFCSLLMMLTQTAIATQTTLTEQQWKMRLIVAFASKDAPEEVVFQEWLTANACRLKERDVQMFLLDGEKTRSLTGMNHWLDEESIQQLVRQRRYSDAPFELMLIGKDGGIKAQAITTAALDDFIIQIDGMPMRKAEASQQSSDCNLSQ